MKRRHCSICHLPGHDRRSHGKRTRRNVEMGFYDGSGFHPIRASKDYDENRTESDWTRSRILSGGFALRRSDGTYRKPSQDEKLAILKSVRPGAYKQQMAPPKIYKRKRLPASVERIERLTAKAESLREHLKHDKAAELTALVGRSGRGRGEIDRIPIRTLERMGGKAPKADSDILKDRRSGRKYAKWEYALDTLADAYGYSSGDRLKAAVEDAQKRRRELREMEAEIADLERAQRSKRVA